MTLKLMEQVSLSTIRLFHIMLLKLPIMLFSNAAKCSLLCYQTSLLFHVMLSIKIFKMSLVSFVIL